MGKRLLLGPVMIALLVLLALVDHRAAGSACPGVLAWMDHGMWPEGAVLLPVVALLCAVCAVELARLLRKTGVAVASSLAVCAALMGLGLVFCGPLLTRAGIGEITFVLAAAGVVCASAMSVLRERRTDGVLASVGAGLLVYVYLGLMAGSLFVLRRDFGAPALLYVLLVTKSCDIGAYFTGTAIGTHKLIPWLSNGKTWEGLAGGVAFAGAVGAIGGAWMGLGTLHHVLPVSVSQGVMLGAVLALVGQAGDLLESAFKRDAHAKDSGSVVPGFGGVLDVVDSPLLAMPVACWMLRVFTV